MRLRLLFVLGLAACATTGAGSTPTRSTTTISVPAASPSGGGTATVAVTTTHDGRGASVALAAAPDAVWAALPDVLAGEGVAVEHVDQAGRVVGNRRLAVTRSLGRRRLSQLVDCGTNPFGEPLADSHRVEFSVLSSVKANQHGTGSVVETVLTAVGTASGAAASSAVRCESKGVLENAINRALTLHFAG